MDVYLAPSCKHQDPVHTLTRPPPAQVDVENQYYNSKGLLETEDGLDEALAGFQQVLEMECEDREKWCAGWPQGWVGWRGGCCGVAASMVHAKGSGIK